MKWPNSTNRGTALLKFLHQYEEKVLVKDEYIRWFVGNETIETVEKGNTTLFGSRSDPEGKFGYIAYWYTILREKYFDDLIEKAILNGCEQLLLLGSGFDTRFLRLSALKEKTIRTVEVDRSQTILTKRKILKNHIGKLPKYLYLIPMDFNQDDLISVFQYGLRKDLRTICIWQGVSYYLRHDTVSSVLNFIKTELSPSTIVGFDCCSPLMLKKNDKIPGIAYNIDRLNAIGEPYLFGMFIDPMKKWLVEKGFDDIAILEQDQLEERYVGRKTLPDNMWYVVSARS